MGVRQRLSRHRILKSYIKIFLCIFGRIALKRNGAHNGRRRKQKKENILRSTVFGLLDCCVAIFLFLPFFGQKSNGEIKSVSLLNLTGVEPYTKAAYLIIVFAIILCGILTLALQNLKSAFWLKIKNKISLILSAVGAVIFMASLQPYAAVFTFIFLVIKALMLIKRS